MSNILVSPELIKNLVSVRSLTRENPVTIEFDECALQKKDTSVTFWAERKKILSYI